MESSAHVQAGMSPARQDLESNCEQSFSATSDSCGQFIVVVAGCMLVSETGDTANLARCMWLGLSDKISARWGAPRAETLPACARFTFGDDRLGEVHCAADSPVGIVGNRGNLAAFAPEVEIPTLFREGALDALGG